MLSALAGVSVHPYRDAPPETALADYIALRALIVQYAPPGKAQLPLYIGEVRRGWCARAPGREFPCTATETLARPPRA